MNIVVFGAKGRVGKRVAETAKQRGHNVWLIDKNMSENALDKPDVVINFAAADATKDVCEFCLKYKCPLVSGTTGLDEGQNSMMENLSESVQVIQKSNFSEGINMMYKLCEQVSKNLKWDCAVIETHRKGKKDAPSGTAKDLAGIISENMGSFSSVEVHSLRLGSNLGRHEVVFAAQGESITITHQAESLDIFAVGAVKTAEQLIKT